MKIFLLLPLFVFPTLLFAQTQVSPQIYDTNDNVGIGVKTPIEKLDVAGKIRANGDLIAWGAGDIGGLLSLVNYAKTEDGAAQRWSIYNMKGPYGNSLQFWAYDQKGCVNGGLCQARFTIQDNGYVGIATATPKSELSVNGTITTKKIKVTASDWPDFVFDPTYKLPSLAEVERYVTEHKHLPDIPSETEIVANGLDLSEMVKMQMKKIEELTLYIIEQQKQINALQKAVNGKANSK